MARFEHLREFLQDHQRLIREQERQGLLKNMGESGSTSSLPSRDTILQWFDEYDQRKLEADWKVLSQRDVGSYNNPRREAKDRLDDAQSTKRVRVDSVEIKPSAEKKRRTMEALDRKEEAQSISVEQEEEFIPAQCEEEGSVWMLKDAKNEDRICIHDPVDGKAIWIRRGDPRNSCGWIDK